MGFIDRYNLALQISELESKLIKKENLKVFTKKAHGIFKGDAPILYLSVKKDGEPLFVLDATDRDLVYLYGELETEPGFYDFKKAFFDGKTEEASMILNQLIQKKAA